MHCYQKLVEVFDTILTETSSIARSLLDSGNAAGSSAVLVLTSWWVTQTSDQGVERVVCLLVRLK
jgi:hypothetical protein